MKTCRTCHRDLPNDKIKTFYRMDGQPLEMCVDADACIKARQGSTDRVMRKIGAAPLPGLFGEAP